MDQSAGWIWLSGCQFILLFCADSVFFFLISNSSKAAGELYGGNNRVENKDNLAWNYVCDFAVISFKSQLHYKFC